MDDDAIREMATRLEAAAPLDGAKVCIIEEKTGLHCIVANRDGYLRLAAAFLEAAVSSPKADYSMLAFDAVEMFDAKSDVFLNQFEIREDLVVHPFDDPPQPSADWLSTAFYIGFLLTILMFIVVGAVTVWKQIF